MSTEKNKSNRKLSTGMREEDLHEEVRLHLGSEERINYENCGSKKKNKKQNRVPETLK